MGQTQSGSVVLTVRQSLLYPSCNMSVRVLLIRGQATEEVHLHLEDSGT
jgi:hypothetical protein